MFQLIISILAIILAVSLAGVSVYYGGAAFSNGSESAQYATITNQGSQIEGAMTLHRAEEGVEAADLDELRTDEYLKQVPVAPNSATVWTLANVDGVDGFDAVVVTGFGSAVCDVDEEQVQLATDDAAGVAASFVEVSGCTTTGGTPMTIAGAGFDAAADTTVFYYNL
jgi:hypothetical protein